MKKNLITTSLLLALPTLAFAQTEKSKAELDTVTVYSAYATPVNQDKTASSVTVLTEKDFAERNATYVSDVLKTVPSVEISASGGRGTLTGLFIRGAETNQSVIVIDGVKVNPVSGNGYDFGSLSLSNIDRIEVLRGEQSALWGSDAMGGIVYIITKSGLYKDKPFNVDFDIGTGSHGTVDGSATVSGYNNGFYYSVHGDSHRTRGISAKSKDIFHYRAINGTNFTTGGFSENDKFHSDNASLRIGYDDNAKGVELLATHSTQTGHYDNDLSTEHSFDDYSRTRETRFKLGGYVGSDDELLKHKVSVSHVKTDNDTIDVWGNSTFDAKRLNTNYQLDVNFDREGNVKQSVSLLADYEKLDYASNSYSVTNKFTDKSAATEYRLITDEDHSFSISGRYTDNSMYGDYFNARFSGGYRLSPNFRAHASFGTATQTPTVTEYFGLATWGYAPNFDLNPEKSKGGDVGLLIESNDKRHSLDMTYFARNVKDLITYSFNASLGQSQYVNAKGTSQIRGVEVAYNGKLTDKLTAFANYTFTMAKDSTGLQLARRPKNTANAGLAYQITDALGSHINLLHVGKRIDTYPYRTEMPSYTLVNFGVDYKISKNLTVYANLNNVFDKKYENILGYGQDGRNVYVGLKGSF